MSVVLVPKPHTVSIAAGQILCVKADKLSAGYVSMMTGAPDYVPAGRTNIAADSVQVFGPYQRAMRAQVTANRGSLSYDFVTDLEAAGLRVIPAEPAQNLVAQAVTERAALTTENVALKQENKELKKTMLAEKFKNLASLAQTIPVQLSALADDSTARLLKAQTEGTDAHARINTVITQVEEGVKAVVDVANQMSNGAPLATAGDASKKPAATS